MEVMTMKPFLISTDTTADLPADYCTEHNIDIHPLFYRFNDDTVYGGDINLSQEEFYARMRNGEMPTTMATNPEDSREFFADRISEGYDIIHIAFSSALSSSYQNASIAAREALEDAPDAKITVIDSFAASMGEGLLVYKAVEYAKTHNYEETVAYIEETKKHISHQFTVDDLFHLHRGGRVSRATAIIGSLVAIKPLLHVDDTGHLIAVGKIRGRKKSLAALVDTMIDTMGNHDNQVVMLSHGDCIEDANAVKDMILERCPNVKKVLINMICPTIGAHAGPGTIALFFEADVK